MLVSELSVVTQDPFESSLRKLNGPFMKGPVKCSMVRSAEKPPAKEEEWKSKSKQPKQPIILPFTCYSLPNESCMLMVHARILLFVLMTTTVTVMLVNVHTSFYTRFLFFPTGLASFMEANFHHGMRYIYIIATYFKILTIFLAIFFTIAS